MCLTLSSSFHFRLAPAFNSMQYTAGSLHASIKIVKKMNGFSVQRVSSKSPAEIFRTFLILTRSRMNISKLLVFLSNACTQRCTDICVNEQIFIDILTCRHFQGSVHIVYFGPTNIYQYFYRLIKTQKTDSDANKPLIIILSRQTLWWIVLLQSRMKRLLYALWSDRFTLETIKSAILSLFGDKYFHILRVFNDTCVANFPSNGRSIDNVWLPKSTTVNFEF